MCLQTKKHKFYLFASDKWHWILSWVPKLNLNKQELRIVVYCHLLTSANEKPTLNGKKNTVKIHVFKTTNLQAVTLFCKIVHGVFSVTDTWGQ